MFVLMQVSCSESTQPTNTKLITSYDYKPNETEVLLLINNHRQDVGLAKLNVINHISAICETHNFYMIDNHVINHDYFYQRSENMKNVLHATRVGENVAYNYINPQSVLSAWLNSPAHKQNIEGDFTDFGISISVDSITGRNYYTNIFIKR